MPSVVARRGVRRWKRVGRRKADAIVDLVVFVEERIVWIWRRMLVDPDAVRGEREVRWGEVIGLACAFQFA